VLLFCGGDVVIATEVTNHDYSRIVAL
jgi:hypothetical protein